MILVNFSASNMWKEMNEKPPHDNTSYITAKWYETISSTVLDIFYPTEKSGNVFICVLYIDQNGFLIIVLLIGNRYFSISVYI